MNPAREHIQNQKRRRPFRVSASFGSANRDEVIQNVIHPLLDGKSGTWISVILGINVACFQHKKKSTLSHPTGRIIS
jgi:hypothetical protein